MYSACVGHSWIFLLQHSQPPCSRLTDSFHYRCLHCEFRSAYTAHVTNDEGTQDLPVPSCELTVPYVITADGYAYLVFCPTPPISWSFTCPPSGSGHHKPSPTKLATPDWPERSTESRRTWLKADLTTTQSRLQFNVMATCTGPFKMA